jgi:hypothetical protein
MPHVILLGDSIFDNAAYVSGGPDVTSQVREALPSEWTATLLAVDGATTEGIPDQTRRLPPTATQLVLSVGGNNALLQISILDARASSVAHALGLLANIAEEFERDYRSAIAACLRPGLPLTVCTIYNGNFPDPQYQRVVSTAVTIFNDVILKVAIDHRLPVIDLRAICSHPEDYANPIEPSSLGGQKIARVIAGTLTNHSCEERVTRIISR